MEADYRKKIQDLYDKLETALSNVDPDIVEVENSMGALTLTFSDRSRCILSAQPSVKQLWLALASRGTAYHFNYDETSNQWKDDRGQGIEVLSFLETYLKEMTQMEIPLQTKKVVIYTMEHCPYCVRAIKLLEKRGIPYQENVVQEDDDAEWERLYKLSGMRTMPQIFAGNRLIGGYAELSQLDGKDQLKSLE